MDGSTARDVIDELEQVREDTRRDRRVSSVPLLTFGMLTLLYAATLQQEPYRNLYGAGDGLITITKGDEGRRPRTWAQLTRRARRA